MVGIYRGQVSGEVNILPIVEMVVTISYILLFTPNYQKCK